MPFADLGTARIHYSEVGQGEPVLLIQGTGLTAAGWSPQIEALSASYRVISCDNRGIGKSSCSDGDISIDSMAGDVIALVQHLDTGPVHLVGHSLGGIIARRAARRAPERCKSLSLLCTLPTGRDGVTPRWASIGNQFRSMVGTKLSRRRAFAELVSSPARIERHGIDFIIEQLTNIFGRQLEELPAVVSKQILAMAKDKGRPDLPEVRRIPTLIVSGADDKIAPPIFGERLHGAIEGSSLMVIAQEGHAVTIQDAPRINDLLLRHFASTSNTPRAAAL